MRWARSHKGNPCFWRTVFETTRKKEPFGKKDIFVNFAESPVFSFLIQSPPFPSVRPGPNARKSWKAGQNLPPSHSLCPKVSRKTDGRDFCSNGSFFCSNRSFFVQTDHDKVRTAKNSGLLPDHRKCYCHQDWTVEKKLFLIFYILAMTYYL